MSKIKEKIDNFVMMILCILSVFGLILIAVMTIDAIFGDQEAKVIYSRNNVILQRYSSQSKVITCTNNNQNDINIQIGNINYIVDAERAEDLLIQEPYGDVIVTINNGDSIKIKYEEMYD